MEDQIKTPWRTSSYSGNGGGNCVETSNTNCDVLVRDSQDRDGAHLAVSPASWSAFTRRLQRRP